MNGVYNFNFCSYDLLICLFIFSGACTGPLSLPPSNLTQLSPCTPVLLTQVWYNSKFNEADRSQAFLTCVSPFPYKPPFPTVEAEEAEDTEDFVLLTQVWFNSKFEEADSPCMVSNPASWLER